MRENLMYEFNLYAERVWDIFEPEIIVQSRPKLRGRVREKRRRTKTEDSKAGGTNEGNKSGERTESGQNY